MHEETGDVKQPVVPTHCSEIREEVRPEVPNAMDDPKCECGTQSAVLQAHLRKGKPCPTSLFEESCDKTYKDEGEDDRGHHLRRDDDRQKEHDRCE